MVKNCISLLTYINIEVISYGFPIAIDDSFVIDRNMIVLPMKHSKA